MSLIFQSLRSGSSGNSLYIRAGDTALLVDAGFSSQRAYRQALEDLPQQPDAVLVSHLHRDHINYSALRVLQTEGIPVYVFVDDVPAVALRHFNGSDMDGLTIRPFGRQSFLLGDFVVHPFEVPHFGTFRTFGFELRYVQGERAAKVVAASDFSDWQGLLDWFQDSHFIYVESNHDPALLRANPNPNSRHHLRNEKCGWLLRHAFDGSEALPIGVMLGHLSDERNDPDVARQTVQDILSDGGYGHVPVHVAPRFTASPPVVLCE